MKRKILSLTLALSLLTGCAGGVTGNGATALNPGQLNLPGIPPAADKQADQALTTFGGLLLRQVRKEGENTLISPLSILLALSMTANGAEGETLDAFLDTLGGGVSLEALNANCAALIEDYAALGGSTQCNIANSLWLDDKLTPNDAFLQRCIDTYGAGLYQADLDTEQTVKAVNAWVKEQTRDMINGILSEPPREETVLLLVNALYLKNTWQHKFAAEGTHDKPFYQENGTEMEIPFLCGGIWELQYISTETETGVILPYDDGRLAFMAVMPQSGTLTEYLNSWDQTRLNTLLDGAAETRVQLSLPKFEAEWSGSLNDALCALGLADAFDPDAADFSGMGTTGDSLYIDYVAHKTRIEVNEKGTEAAAVTAVAVSGSDMPPEDYKTLTFNRPFVYAIVDLEREVPLFLGTFEAPDSAQ